MSHSTTALRTVGLWALSAALCACSAKRDDGGASATVPQDSADAVPEPAPIAVAPSEEDARAESAHHVVFADRTTQSYLLLLTGSPTAAPTREELAALVSRKLEGAADEPEAKLLLELIASDPAPAASEPGLEPSESQQIRHADLLGLHIALLPLAPAGEEALIPLEVLRDPISTRALSAEERASLPERRFALVLRAHYRNRYGVRGLRLLQTLVRIVAQEQGALIHDPDTAETVGEPVFSARRLQSTVGNIADQVVVVPFPDPRNGREFVRLSTRGMRRFGSVDLELDGLRRDTKVLEAATHLLYGLAYRMVRDGEYDREGYAVEVDDIVELGYEDIAKAYAGRGGKVPRCETCPQVADLHLVERPAEDHDPVEHVVARVVAPRETSDAAGYDHPAWVAEALRDLLGVP
ncbi:MAG: hypothetical protein AAF799_16875 [Myxococcota bacterium]